MIKRRILIRPVALAAMLIALFSGTGTSNANTSSWSIVSSPNLGNNDTLSAVAAVSSSDVWAVGNYINGANDQTLIEQWNGSFWVTVPSQNVAGANNYLTGLTVVSANDVWAVGYSQAGGGPSTLAEHWNGVAWAIVPSANQSGNNDKLQAVSAVSASDVWAVGLYSPDFVSPFQTLIEHWNGTSWGIVSSPNRGAGHNILNGVSAVSSTKVEAAGSYNDGSDDQTLTEVWNGSSWQVRGSVDAVGSGFQEENNYLYAIATNSTGTPTAVGRAGSDALIEQCCLANSWRLVSGSAAGSSSQLDAVANDPSGDAWTVGYDFSGGVEQTLVEEQTGSGLQIMASPNEGTGDGLTGVAAVASNDVWAVGSYSDSLGSHTLIEHYTSGGPTMSRLAQVS
ncbi:MAG: hypothetical protein M3Z66_08485 [Chloroflexota bacterium]|nr:hypothetical protein [Chloroflexota bacterium]